jgi:2,3-bisphosphoglycerate-independent phosphoglycerate mutase
MDRDYKGGMIRVECEAVVGNVGRKAANFDEALAMVAQDHAKKVYDPSVEPIVVGNPRPVGEKTVFFNAIFRSDRQEPITAALLGHVEFITKQATQKKKLDTWDGFQWVRQFQTLVNWGMVEYHKDLGDKGLKAVFHDKPHEHNVLYLLSQRLPEFRFLFLTEGVKEKHMGLFSRGRRSRPLAPAETQFVVPSYGKEDGVASDNDLYKVPAMRHPEIAAKLVEELKNPQWDLIAVNFPGADMIGHLVTGQFEACRATMLSLEEALKQFIPVALENGWVTVVTADHGNIEHYGPDHGNNDVLTTLVIPEGARVSAKVPEGGTARLFDISWTILEALGTSVEALQAPPFDPLTVADPNRLVGVSLLTPREP